MLVLTQDQLEELVAHARHDIPYEACGLLAGREHRVERIYPMRNAAHSPVIYRLDPEEQYSVFMEIEAASREMIGIYHSHPSGPAYPSTTDVGLALYPGVAYLIVSLIDSHHPELRAFFIDDSKITECPIDIENGR